MLHLKISIHCFTGYRRSSSSRLPPLLSVSSSFLIFSATIHPHLIRIIRRRRRREALSLKEGTKLFVSLSWNMPSIDASLVGWWSSIFISSSSVGSPAAQVHDGPQRLLWLLGLLVSNSDRRHGGRGSRELLGLRKGPEVVLGMLVNRPQSVIPSAEALVLECLHCSHTCCHYPSFPHMTHLNSLSKTQTTINNKKNWFWVVNRI